MVVEAEIFPAVLACLKDEDEYVKKNVATLIREIAKHTPELAQLITNAGGVGAVVDYINDSKGNVRLPGIMMLGYVDRPLRKHSPCLLLFLREWLC
ncbi:Sperm-associated antigen 6 [Desmophyllum pertusum]|uniref:Sperm-associated antigen 6 n=1 Tax=Desmophyllum pertusum TaxID=174260 RepID=A0A9W9YRT4_9CNID|nr:Sperm-associated antigen 6 [Desmophyllum pertusum]